MGKRVHATNLNLSSKVKPFLPCQTTFYCNLLPLIFFNNPHSAVPVSQEHISDTEHEPSTVHTCNSDPFYDHARQVMSHFYIIDNF